MECQVGGFFAFKVPSGAEPRGQPTPPTLAARPKVPNTPRRAHARWNAPVRRGPPAGGWMRKLAISYFWFRDFKISADLAGANASSRLWP